MKPTLSTNITAGQPATVAPRKRGFFSARFMRSLSIGSKLWSTTILMSLPLLVLGGFYIHSLGSTLWFTSTEQRGFILYQPLDQIAQHIVRREELATTALARKSNATIPLRRLDEELDAKLTEFEALEGKDGNAATHSMIKEFRAEWTSLRAAKPNTPQYTMAAHEHLLGTVAGVSNQIATDWKLNLDSEVTAYNLIDVTISTLPDARRFLIEARAHMVAMYAGTEYVPSEGAKVASLVALFNDRIASAQDEIKFAAVGAADRPALLLQIGEVGNDWDAGIVGWTSDVARELASGHPSEDAIRNLLNASAKYSQSLNSTLDTVLNAASGALGIRYAAQLHIAIAALLGSSIVILCAVLLMLALARRMAGAIARLLHIATCITAGQYDAAIDDGGTDEISRLFASMNMMQQKLAADRAPVATNAPDSPMSVETHSEQSTEHMRIRSALDSASGSFMVADAGGKIVYTNAAANEMLRRAEADIRKQLPSFSASAVHGADFDIFHKSPRQQQQFIASLTRPHTAQIMLGGRTFRLIFNPILSVQGQRLGTVVEWTDRTAEVSAEGEINTVLAAVLTGNFAERIDLNGKSGFFALLGRGINQLVDNVQEIIAKVKLTSSEVHTAAEALCEGNASISQRSEQESASLEETASSMEQITAAVKKNADNAHQANQLASAAREQAQAGGMVVNQAISAMADINDSSKKIANIIGVIDEIAFQTNLLALNAAVEAARAGEQGRGFAVVASEVRNLAGRSAAAAKEIKDLIRDSVRKVDSGTRLVTQSGQTLEQIVTAVKKVTDVVAEIASASIEQTRGIEQVNRAITQMDQMTQQNSGLVEQATSASHVMAQQTAALSAMLSGYQTDTVSAGRPVTDHSRSRDAREPVKSRRAYA
jgi:methyl-accepting chemotaxis protein